MRGAFQSKEEILRTLKEENDQRHLHKIMTLIAIKIDDKFTTLGKAFLFFDIDGDQTINRTEFHKGIESLRVKLPVNDIDLVFDHMDKDKDN